MFGGDRDRFGGNERRGGGSFGGGGGGGRFGGTINGGGYSSNYGGQKSGDPGANLRKPKWDMSRLPKFEKNFYQEHPSVAMRTQVHCIKFKVKKIKIIEKNEKHMNVIIRVCTISSHLCS